MLREAREEVNASHSDSHSNSDWTTGGAHSMLQDGYCGSSFDDYGAQEFLDLGSCGDVRKEERLLIMFVSTTGDAEHTDSIRHTWAAL